VEHTYTAFEHVKACKGCVRATRTGTHEFANAKHVRTSSAPCSSSKAVWTSFVRCTVSKSSLAEASSICSVVVLSNFAIARFAMWLSTVLKYLRQSATEGGQVIVSTDARSHATSRVCARKLFQALTTTPSSQRDHPHLQLSSARYLRWIIMRLLRTL
jgi:hypothetical protein